MPSGYWQNCGKFPSLFSEVLRFCLHLLKDEEAVENLKTLSSSSGIGLDNHLNYTTREKNTYILFSVYMYLPSMKLETGHICRMQTMKLSVFAKSGE